MSRIAPLLTLCLLGVIVGNTTGCNLCNPCNPCGCGPVNPWDTTYGGCVETGLFGQARMSHCERKELRRAMRCGGCGKSQCSSCNGMMGGDFSGMQTGMIPGGNCPTCQQQMPMDTQMQMGTPIPMGTQYENSGMSQPMMVPSPMPAEPNLSIPTPVPTTSNQVHPTSGEYYNPPPTAFLPGTTPNRPVQQMLYAP